jgi:phosphoribosyl-dephospho-CoA transferase
VIAATMNAARLAKAGAAARQRHALRGWSLPREAKAMRLNASPATMPLPRHTRVWLNWPTSMATIDADEAHRPAIEAHAARNHAFVARRRQTCDASSDGVLLGLRLPRSSAVRSVPFRMSVTGIRQTADAMTLPESLACESRMPIAWRHALQSLVRQMEDIGTIAHVYGSLAWQVDTGTIYLADDSDIDLLVRPVSRQQANAVLALLQETSASAPAYLDGEIEFPDGSAVAWRELASGASKVLVKKGDGIELVETESIWNQSAWQ